MGDERVVPVTEFRDGIAEIVGCIQHTGSRVILTKHGKEVVAVVPMSELHVLAEIERLSDLVEAEKQLNETATEDLVALDDLKKLLGL